VIIQKKYRSITVPVLTPMLPDKTVVSIDILTTILSGGTFNIKRWLFAPPET
jgi:hypothetical protein